MKLDINLHMTESTAEGIIWLLEGNNAFAAETAEFRRALDEAVKSRKS